MPRDFRLVNVDLSKPIPLPFKDAIAGEDYGFKDIVVGTKKIAARMWIAREVDGE